jgi:hypothetical protein
LFVTLPIIIPPINPIPAPNDILDSFISLIYLKYVTNKTTTYLRGLELVEL